MDIWFLAEVDDGAKEIEEAWREKVKFILRFCWTVQ